MGFGGEDFSQPRGDERLYQEHSEPRKTAECTQNEAPGSVRPNLRLGDRDPGLWLSSSQKPWLRKEIQGEISAS